MISWLIIIILTVLVLASYLDIKYKQIPSVLLTGLLFIVAILNIENMQFGILAGLFAWVVKDLIFEWQGLEFGVADVKIIVLIGLLIPNIFSFFVFILIFAVFQFFYTVFWQWRFGYDPERPFIPCLLAVYFVLMMGGII